MLRQSNRYFSIYFKAEEIPVSAGYTAQTSFDKPDDENRFRRQRTARQRRHVAYSQSKKFFGQIYNDCRHRCALRSDYRAHLYPQ